MGVGRLQPTSSSEIVSLLQCTLLYALEHVTWEKEDLKKCRIEEAKLEAALANHVDF